jgi:hypothetical protein
VQQIGNNAAPYSTFSHKNSGLFLKAQFKLESHLVKVVSIVFGCQYPMSFFFYDCSTGEIY